MRHFIVTVQVSVDADLFLDGECAGHPDELLTTIRSEISSNLEECGADVIILSTSEFTIPSGVVPTKES